MRDVGRLSPWSMVRRHDYSPRVQRHSELEPLAQVIRTFRKAAGFTQENFAYEAQLDRGFVGAVERAERNVGFRKIRELLVGLGIDWRDFGAALQEVDRLPRTGTDRPRSPQNVSRD